MHQIEQLFTVDATTGTVRGVIDELTDDGCQFLSILCLDNGNLHLDVRAENNHLFHKIYPEVDIVINTKDGKIISQRSNLGALQPKLLKTFTQEHTSCKQVYSLDVHIDVNAQNIKSFKIHHKVLRHGCGQLVIGQPSVYEASQQSVMA